MNSNIMRNVAVATLALGAAFATAQDIGVQVNNETVNFKQQPPVYVSGRVLVPLRGIFEKMGASVQWHPADRTVTADKGSKNVTLKIGEKWASVDGQTLAMDVPGQILNGATMVPIRFVSESLGAQVNWNDENRLVSIYSVGGDAPKPGKDTAPPKEPKNSRKFVMDAGTVIPVTLQTRVNSKDSKTGDLVRAAISNFNAQPESWDNNRFQFPTGSIIEGRIVSAIPKDGDRPGVIEMNFSTIVLPDGRSSKIDGSLIGLDDKSVARNKDGVLIAKKTNKDNRLVYTGYGAGAGLIVGLLTKQPLEKTAIGGLLGYLAGSLTPAEKQANDVNLEPGAKFGVKLDQQATITLTRGTSNR